MTTAAMTAGARARRRYALEWGVAVVALAGWSIFIFGRVGGAHTAMLVSDFGLAEVALGAGAACLTTSHRNRGRYRVVWFFLGLSTSSWGFGQVVWTYYEVGRHQPVPFPSLADAGYLSAVPLAVVALLLLPSGSESAAGRLRTIFDGLIIATSLLYVSWLVVLGKVFHSDSGTRLAKVLSLAYPLGDVVLVTIVLYAILRARQRGNKVPLPLMLVGAGLVAQSVADSGFTYLTGINAYHSGDPIDTGWFVAFALILLAARAPSASQGETRHYAQVNKSGDLLLPYAAVMMSVVTSVIEVGRHHNVDTFGSWDRSIIMTLLVGRQVLTLFENIALNRALEDRMSQLSASQQHFEALVQQSSDVVTVIDADCRITYQSESVLRVFGYRPDALLGRPISDLVTPDSSAALNDALTLAADHPDGVAVMEVSVRHADGRVCAAEVTVTNLLETPNVEGFVLNCRDVSDQKALESQLVHQAFHDSLTELANRALFRDRVEHVLLRDSGDGHRSAVLFLDLDGFKQINDSLGHAAGDVLLTRVAERLRSCVRPGDTVARLGGDEFGVLVEDTDRYVDTQSLAGRIQAALNAPFVIDDRKIHVSASIGIATPEEGTDASDQLLRNADLAMYRAKASGGSSVERYNPEMHTELMDRLQLESDLRQALARGQLVLLYQPIVTLTSNETVGVEALLRWQHPVEGLVGPDRFIRVAEMTGLIKPIGRWVLHEACRQVAMWRAQDGQRDLYVGVNISARQFQGDDFVTDVAIALNECVLPPESLVLEMTESVLFEHSDQNVDQLREMSAIGVRFAIDDFGTGYSSLAYLHRFPVDILKIDRTFVDQLSDPHGDPELVRSILRIGESLHTATVAEGIEKSDQLALLREFGCDLGQGFYFAHPMPAEELTSWFRSTALTSPRVGARSQPAASDVPAGAAPLDLGEGR